MSKTAHVAFALLLVGPPLASAQGNDAADRTEGRLRLFPALFENFFQAPDGEPKEDVETLLTEARVTRDLGGTGGWEGYVAGRFTAFESGLDNSVGGLLGLRFDRRPHAAEVILRHERDRPIFDVGDELEQAAVTELAIEYGWRFTDDWQLGLLGNAQRQEFDLTTSKDNDLLTAGASLRFRGWGYVISPEIGYETGSRDATDPNEDRDIADLWLKLRSLATEDLYLTLRFRNRQYEYTVADPLASNFGREDDRNQWTLAVDYAVTQRLSVQAYYDYLDADSDKPSRIFTSQIFGVGITTRF